MFINKINSTYYNCHTPKHKITNAKHHQKNTSKLHIYTYK